MRWAIGAGLLLWWLSRRRPALGPEYGPEYRPELLEQQVDPSGDSRVLGPAYSPCPCPSGYTPTVDANGDCACVPVSVEVIPNW
jgi:hypothetical protein